MNRAQLLPPPAVPLTGPPGHRLFGKMGYDLRLAYASAYAGSWRLEMPGNASIRYVRLFKNGRSQAVRIPREFELPGEEAILRRDKSGRLVLQPLPRKKLVDLLAAWTPLGEKDRLPEIDDQPAEPVEF